METIFTARGKTENGGPTPRLRSLQPPYVQVGESILTKINFLLVVLMHLSRL